MIGPRVSLLALFAAACVPPPAAPASPAHVLRVSNLTAPQGAALEQACTPTGPELCFNAIDDNCNGVIDEGCGAQTGLLQFTIAWAGNADVNLVVHTATDEWAPAHGDQKPSSTFHLDHDCPGDDGCHGQNVENVYFDGQDPPSGRYEVHVNLVDLHGADAPVPVRLGARLGSRSIGVALSLGAEEEEKRKVLTFDVP